MELPNDVRLGILGNSETSKKIPKLHGIIA